MKIAELFVQLGVKGADVAGKALSGMAKGINHIASASLEAKAAVAAVVYGMERMTGWASQAGMDLYKFGVTTGLSTDELQKWQYALGRFDVTGEETANTIMGIQTAMSDMLMGKGSPEGLALLADKVGFDQTKARDTFYVLGKIQEFVKTQPPDIANNLMKSFGISGNMFQALKSMNMERDKLSKKQIISEREIEQLKNINMAWKDFWFTLRTMGIKFIAAEGIQGIRILTNAFKGMMSIGKDLGGFISKFKGLGTVLAGLAVLAAAWASPWIAMQAAIAGVIYLLSEYQKYKTGKDNIFSSVGNFTKDAAGGIADWYKAGGIGKLISSGAESVGKGLFTAEGGAVPTAPTGPGAATQNKNITQNNTINIDGAGSPEDTASHVQRGVTGAFRQMSAQAGGI